MLLQPGQLCSGHLVGSTVSEHTSLLRLEGNQLLSSVESVARSCQVCTILCSSFWDVKSLGKHRGAALCPRMLLGCAPSAEKIVLTWAFK